MEFCNVREKMHGLAVQQFVAIGAIRVRFFTTRGNGAVTILTCTPQNSLASKALALFFSANGFERAVL